VKATVTLDSCLWCGNDFEKTNNSAEHFCSAECKYSSEYEYIEYQDD